MVVYTVGQTLAARDSFETVSPTVYRVLYDQTVTYALVDGPSTRRPPHLGEEEHAVALLTLAHGHAWAVPETALHLHPRVRPVHFPPIHPSSSSSSSFFGMFLF